MSDENCNSCAGDCEPQAPGKTISIEQADRDSAVGRNNEPYNPGGECHVGNCRCGQ